MSTLRENLEKAIQEYIADDPEYPGIFLSGYALVAVGVLPSKPGWSAYRYVVPEQQPRHASIGLTSMLVDAVNDYEEPDQTEYAEEGDDQP